MGILTRKCLVLVSPEEYLRLLNRGCLAGHGLLPAIKDACETRKHTFRHWLSLWTACELQDTVGGSERTATEGASGEHTGGGRVGVRGKCRGQLFSVDEANACGERG